MRQDETNIYRSLLEERPPKLITYVNTPWEEVPDLADYNAKAFQILQRRLRAMTRRLQAQAPSAGVASEGVLILGEAGTGKTHLLMRVARAMSATNPVMFIHKPNNEEAVAQHVWAQLIESLTRHVPGLAPGQSQLDHLLAHVFTAVLTPILEKDIGDNLNAKLKQRWLKLLKQTPSNLFGMLEGGSGRQKHLDYLRNKTLAYLRIHHPDVDQTVARALINYCFLATERDRRATLTWLIGQEIDETTVKRLGLGSLWPEPLDEKDSDIYLRQERERLAIRAIQTVGDLARHYGKPLILAFDQLEGLRGETRLTQRWGDVMQQLFTVVPNMLVLTAVFPGLWESWFRCELHQAVQDRIAQDRLELDPFDAERAEALLAVHLRDTVEELNLPDPIYPFTREDVAELCGKAHSPRTFLQAARNRLDDWLDDARAVVSTSATAVPIPCETPASETSPTASSPDPILKAVMESYRRAVVHAQVERRQGLPNEEDLFGRLSQLLRKLAACGVTPPPDCSGRVTNRGRVMPSNLLVRPAEGPAVALAVCHAQGNSLKSRLENLLAMVGPENDQVAAAAVLVRDGRCPVPTGQSEALLHGLDPGRAVALMLDERQGVAIQALSDLLTAVEQGEVAAGPDARVIDESEFLDAVLRLGLPRTIRAFEELVRFAPVLAGLLGQPLDISLEPESFTQTSSQTNSAALAAAWGNDRVGTSGPASNSTAVKADTLPNDVPCLWDEPAPETLPAELAELTRLLTPEGQSPWNVATAHDAAPPLQGLPSRAVLIPVSGEVEPPDDEHDDQPHLKRTNPAQVRAVTTLLRRWIDTKTVEPEQVLILAPYDAQARALREGLGTLAQRVAVATLENSRERRADVVVAVSTDDQVPPSPALLGRTWMRSAVARARRQWVWIANPQYLINFRFFPIAELMRNRATLSRCRTVPLATLEATTPAASHGDARSA
jgi:hypothetical protein